MTFGKLFQVEIGKYKSKDSFSAKATEYSLTLCQKIQIADNTADHY